MLSYIKLYHIRSHYVISYYFFYLIFSYIILFSVKSLLSSPPFPVVTFFPPGGHFTPRGSSHEVRLPIWWGKLYPPPGFPTRGFVKCLLSKIWIWSETQNSNHIFLMPILILREGHFRIFAFQETSNIFKLLTCLFSQRTDSLNPASCRPTMAQRCTIQCHIISHHTLVILTWAVVHGPTSKYLDLMELNCTGGLL